MENKSIPLNNSLREVDRAVAMGHMKGPWNHIYTSRNSAAGAAYVSADSGYTNLSGFSWPPRLYVCSFCKREFRSAQALGGHMNVHRRDRARLRQSPPSSPPMDLVAAGNCSLPVSDSINLNLIPNPNPNLTPHSSTWMVQKPNKQTATYITSSSLKSSCPFIISSSSGSSAPTKTPNLNYTDQHHNNFEKVNLNKGWEKGGVLRLGFGLGKEDLDLDLELRLGYPS